MCLGLEPGIRATRYVFPWGHEDRVLVADKATHAQIHLVPTGDSWSATSYLPPNTAFQYSFFRVDSKGTVSHFTTARARASADIMGGAQLISESGPAREGKTPGSGILSIAASWHGS